MPKFNYAAAKPLVREAIAFAEEKGALNWKAYGIMTRGVLTVLTGKASDAVRSPTASPRGAAKSEAHFERALAVACGRQAKSWELRAAMSVARLWRDQGKPQQARELLAPVYGWFTEGFDTRDLKEAKAPLEELAS